MPRIRDRKQQNQTIAVTPWMSKKGSVEGVSTGGMNAAISQQPLYSVVLADAHLATSGAAACADFAPCPTVTTGRSQSSASIPAPNSSDGWHSARREPANRDSIAANSVNQRQQQSKQRTTGHTYPRQNSISAPHDPFDLELEADLADKQEQQQLGSPSPSPNSRQQQQCLYGIAQLILLPSGTIAGHFIAQSSSTDQQDPQALQFPVYLGLQGKQVLGIHSCYRDPEWVLLQMTVKRYSPDSSNCNSSRSKSSRGQQRDQAAGNSITPATAGALQAVKSGPEQKDHDCSSSNGKQEAQQRQWQECSESRPAKRLCLGNQQQQHQQQQQQEPQGAISAPAQSPPQGAAAAVDQTDLVGSMSEDETILTPTHSTDSQAAAAAVFGTINEVSSSSSTAAEAVAWVQRTGGDLVTLSPADMDDEDTAAVILQDNLGLDPDFVCVEFKGRTLLAGAAADGQLSRTWPQLVGQEGVVVNVGKMTISNLPAEWLGPSL